MVRALTLTTIDLEDGMLPRFEIREIPDRISIMLHQEENEYKVVDYLVVNAAIRKKAAKPVDEDCRVKMCEWCYQVVDFCKFRRETVGIGMSYVDRYLCSEKGKKALGDRKEYQLVAMTCLYIAIKLHEPLEMETSLLADLSRGCYTEMEFANMEQKILEALIWRVNGPTALGFIQNFLMFLPDETHSATANAIFDYARYQTELAIGDHAFVKLSPSIVGAAALFNALEGMDQSIFPNKVRKRFIRTVAKYTPIDMELVEETQHRLSMLMIQTITADEVKKVDAACLEAVDSDLEDSDDESTEEEVEEEEEDEELSEEDESESEEYESEYDGDDGDGFAGDSPPPRRKIYDASPVSVARRQ
jgi:hypothetical protein